MRFLLLMVRLPMAALAYGMDLFARTVHELERGAKSGNGSENSSIFPSINKESNGMVDTDLSSDDLKVVRYRIIFKKRDYETELETNEALINYSTDGGSYGALKIAEFFDKVLAGQVPLPAKWKHLRYPRNATDVKWRIPNEDLKYVGFSYEVIRREERQEKDYDRQQVRVLRDIERTLAERNKG